jgi:hypothetical protein
MSWYISKIVFRVECSEPRVAAQFDEQLRLINGNDSGEAYDKAVALGLKDQHSFLNDKQQLVLWKFINVSEIHELKELVDGMEIDSLIKEVDDAERYINFVNDKASGIRKKMLSHFVTTT